MPSTDLAAGSAEKKFSCHDYIHESCRFFTSPCFVQAASKLTMLRWGPRWLMIFSSDIRAWVSLLRAVAGGTERGRGSRQGDGQKEGTLWENENYPDRLVPARLLNWPLGCTSSWPGSPAKAQQAPSSHRNMALMPQCLTALRVWIVFFF